MRDWRRELPELAPGGEIRWEEPMAKHTSFRLGGPAEVFVIPGNRGELCRVVDFAVSRGLPWLVIGRGTNLLVRDGGLRGLVIQVGPGLKNLTCEDAVITAETGLTLAELAAAAAMRGWAGLAFAAGIPGTVGGGIFMNAGAYGSELVQVVEEVTAFYPGLGERTWPRDELALGYRTSRFQRETAVILAARFRLSPGERRVIEEEMADYGRRRWERQPLNFPSAGSVFRRPPGGYAGTLIEQAGLKGTTIGRAQISDLHANFIINLGGATAADVLALIELVRRQVKERTGFELEPEVRVVGEDQSR